MRKTYIPFFIFIFFSVSVMQAQKIFDIEGHRGCRGLYPENTIVAFLHAVQLGVNTLELDVLVTKDGKLVVSHDPYLNPTICTFPDGQLSQEDASKFHKLYDMTYDEISKFDCGSRGNPKFPDQHKMYAVKPLLSEVIDSVEAYIQRNHLPSVQYNIETKSTPQTDDINHPKPAIFSKILYDLLNQKNVLGKCIIQSFDPRTLQEIRKMDASVATSLLVANLNGFNKNIKRLGFIPTIYSPIDALVTKKLIRQCHEKNIKVIPWTVDDESKMKKLKRMGIDGIISDYPDRAIKVLRK